MQKIENIMNILFVILVRNPHIDRRLGQIGFFTLRQRQIHMRRIVCNNGTVRKEISGKIPHTERSAGFDPFDLLFYQFQCVFDRMIGKGLRQ